MVEEADARAGVAAGALRYAAARMFEDGVGDVAAAMDHLQLALDEPPTATFRPVLRALRLHAVEAGSPWTAIDLLDIEMAAAGTVAAKAELAVQKAGLLENPLGARDRARAVIEEALSLVPGHTAALLALEESAIRGGDAALLQSVLDRRLAAAASAGERGRLLCRLALLAEAQSRADRGGAGSVVAGARRGRRQGRGGARPRRDPAGGGARRQGRGAGAGRRAGGGGGGRTRAGGLAGAGGGAGAAPPGRLGARGGADRGCARRRSRTIRRCCSCRPPITWRPGSGRRRASAWITTPSSRNDRDWGATLVGPGRAPRRAPRGRRRGGGRALSPRCWRRAPAIRWRWSRWSASPRGPATRPRRCGWPRRPSIAAATPAERAALAMRAAELAETAAHDLPRAAALARRALEAVPGYAPAAHVLERLYATLGQWGELVKVVEVGAAPRPRVTVARRGGGRGARGRARDVDALRTRGRAVRGAPAGSGQGAGALQRVGRAGRAAARRRCGRCCAPPRRRATRWSPRRPR